MRINVSYKQKEKTIDDAELQEHIGCQPIDEFEDRMEEDNTSDERMKERMMKTTVNKYNSNFQNRTLPADGTIFIFAIQARVSKIHYDTIWIITIRAHPPTNTPT